MSQSASCNMAPHAFKDMGAPTISSDNIYTWKEGPIVKITKDSFTVARMGKKGKFAALDVNPNFKPNPKMRAKYFGRDVEEDQWVGSLLSFQNETKYEFVTASKRLCVQVMGLGFEHVVHFHL